MQPIFVIPSKPRRKTTLFLSNLGICAAMTMLSACGGQGEGDGNSSIPVVVTPGAPNGTPTGTPTSTPPTDSGQVTPARTEVPIRQVRLSDGTIRYAIPITVGGSTVLAGLDTGSIGLRLLPAAQTGLQTTAQPNSETYGSGVILDGYVAQGQVSIGARSNSIDVQQVTGVSCDDAHKEDSTHKGCGASGGIAGFRILGDGIPGEGFFGIIGIRLNPNSKLRHPLIQLGVHRWIVSLPQPGSSQPGSLVLDPDERDLAGFIPVPSGRSFGQVLACFYLQTPTAARACGNTLLDTGAPGIGVFNAGLPESVPDGATARLVFGAEGATSPGLLLRLNDAQQVTNYRGGTDPNVQGTDIRAGVAPYLGYDVLYDADKATIAVRARTGYPNGPAVQQ